MSQRLPRLTSKQLRRVLERSGWELDRTTGSHFIYSHTETQRTLSVPQYNRVMSIGTLSRLLKDAGIDEMSSGGFCSGLEPHVGASR